MKLTVFIQLLTSSCLFTCILLRTCMCPTLINPLLHQPLFGNRPPSVTRVHNLLINPPIRMSMPSFLCRPLPLVCCPPKTSISRPHSYVYIYISHNVCLLGNANMGPIWLIASAGTMHVFALGLFPALNHYHYHQLRHSHCHCYDNTTMTPTNNAFTVGLNKTHYGYGLKISLICLCLQCI